MGELYATLLVRLILPLATLIAALLHFSAFGLAYLGAFAALMHRPSYSLRKHYPAPALAVLSSFSIGLLVVQVTIASLIAAKTLQPSDGGLWSHLDDVGIARFDRSVWDGLRAVLGPALVTGVSLLCLLAEERRSRRSFVYFMLHRGGAPLVGYPRPSRLRLRQTRSLIESSLVTVADERFQPRTSPSGIVATRRWRGRRSGHSFFPWWGVPLSTDPTGVDGSPGGVGGKSSASSSTTLSLDLPALGDRNGSYRGRSSGRPPSASGATISGGDGIVDDSVVEDADGDGLDDFSQSSYQPTDVDDGVAAEMPSRLTRFMAGTGGVFWTAVGLAATGTAVSSVANSFFTAVLFFVVLSWGFGWEGVRPAVAPARVLRCLTALRVTLLLYIFALVAFQLGWLEDVRQSPIVVLLGIRRLSTAGQPQGWTHMMALGGALFCYVVSGLWAKAVRGAYVTRTLWTEALVVEADTVAASLSRPSSFLSAGFSADGLVGGGEAGSNDDGGGGGGSGGGSSVSAPGSPAGSSKAAGKAWASTGGAAPSSGSAVASLSSPSVGGSAAPAGLASRAASAPTGSAGKPPLPPSSSRSRSAPEWQMAAAALSRPPSISRGAPPWKAPIGDRTRRSRLASVPSRLSPGAASGGSGGTSGRSGGSSWTHPLLGLSGWSGSRGGGDGDDLTSSRRLGSALTASTRFGLSAKEFLFLRSLLHLASVALMVWVLVLPGYLTLPLLLLAFLYLAFKRCRNSRVLDYVVYYAMALQLVHAVYVATLEAWGLPESRTADALGLRILSAPVVPAVIQVATITLIALSIYLKEYLKTVRVWEPRRSGGRALMGNVTEQELLEMMLSHREYSAVAKGAFSPFKVILDQFALAALYVAGAAAASALNTVFIVALTAICVTQVVPIMYKRRLIAGVWVSIFVYSMGFMAATSAVCRIGRGDTFDCSRVGVTVGLTAAPTLAVLAYTALVVCASIQVHFTWPWRNDTDEATVRVELSSAFWSFLREYFLYVAYAALLLYPLVSPANFLSYGYLVFLLLCFLVEILAGFATSRRVLGRLWFAVVLFACLGLVARYLVRFDDIGARINQLQLIFGVGAGMSGFLLTLGDAAILIIISLQGRLFLQSAQLAANATQLPSIAPSRPPQSPSGTTLPQPQSSASSASLVTGGLTTTAGHGPQSASVRSSLDAAATAAASPLVPRPGGLSSGSGSGNGSSKDSGLADKARRMDGLSASLAGTSHVDGHDMSAFESTGLVHVDSHASVPRGALMTDIVELPDVSTRAKLLDAKRFLLRVRNSLPVVQTRDAIKWLYVRVRKALQHLLFPYSSILPASAVVAAAIWLDGISCFGGTYLVLGCLVVCLDNRPAISRRSHAVIPLALRILSPTLLLLSFGFMTIQYLYLVLSLQQGAFIVDLQNGDWGPMVRWIGLQFERDSEVGKLFLPITQHAMLAHCLVFVTAFVQRATLRWAASSFSQVEGEQGADNGFGQLSRTGSGLSEGSRDEQIRAGLLSARPISDVVSGLVLDEASGKARVPSSSNSSSGVGNGGGRGRDVGGSEGGPAPVVHPTRAGGSGVSSNCVRGASGSGGSLPLNRTPSRNSSGPNDPADSLSSRVEGLASGRVHFSASSPRPLGPGSPATLTSGVPHDVAGGARGASFGVYAGATDGDAPDVGPPSPYHRSPSARRTNRLVHWCGRSLLMAGRRLGEVLGLLHPFWASWGFDLTYVVLVVGAAVSRTVFSLLHILFVLAVCLVPRRTVSRMWVVCTLFLVTLVLLQYALSLGLPPLVSWSWQLRDDMPSAWQAWLYIDESNDTRKRRTDITIAFIAVICAGTTLNAIPPRLSLRRCGRCAACSSVPGMFGWLRRLFGLGRSHREPPCPSSDASSGGKEEAGAAVGGGPSSSGRVASLEAVAISGVNSSSATLLGMRPPDSGEPPSTCLSFRGCAEEQGEAPLSRCFGFASSGDGSPSQRQPEEVDFTQRPLTFANAVKLAWMRFSGSAVQLYLFAVAAVDPSVFSAVLLGLAFYFFFQFTNVATRRARFVIVRMYVLSVILAVVAYQAPFAPPTREDGSPSPWPRIIGLYKLSGLSSGKDPAAAAALLGLFVSLWILSQMQGRIYESENFRFVLRNMKEDEVLRFRRAIHDHQDRMTEQMLASNELERNKSARAARLQRLQALKNTTRSVDAFFNVCVVQEAELAAKNEAAEALHELEFAPRLSFSAALAAAAADESKLPRLSRSTPGQMSVPSSSRLPGLRFRRSDGTFATPGTGGGWSASPSNRQVGSEERQGEDTGVRRAHSARDYGGNSSNTSAAAFVADVAPGSEPVDTYPLRSGGSDGLKATNGDSYESSSSRLDYADGVADVGAAHPSPEGNQEDFPWWNRMLRAMSRGARWQSHLHQSLRHELRFFATRYSAWPVYLSMLLAVAVTPTIMSVVYPLVLFLYLLVEQPRPPKSAWIALIFYVEAVITFKFVARKFVTPDVRFFVNDYSDKGEIFKNGVHIQAGGIFFDILVLVSLLWHRRILYYRGLWDLTDAEERHLLRPKVTSRAVATPSDAVAVTDPSGLPAGDVMSAEMQLADADWVIVQNAHRLESLGCFEDELPASDRFSSSPTRTSGDAYEASWGVADYPRSGAASAVPGAAASSSSRPREARDDHDGSSLDDACFVSDAVELDVPVSSTGRLSDRVPRVRVHSNDIDAATATNEGARGIVHPVSVEALSFHREYSRGGVENLPSSFSARGTGDQTSVGPRSFSSVKSLPKLDVAEAIGEDAHGDSDQPSLARSAAASYNRSASGSVRKAGISQPSIRLSTESLDLLRRGSTLRSCRSMTLRTLDEEEEGRAVALQRTRSVRHTFTGGVIGGLIGEDADVERPADIDDVYGMGGGAPRSDEDDDQLSTVGSLRSRRSRRGTTPSGFPGLGRRRSSRMPTPSGGGKRRTPMPADGHVEDLITRGLSARVTPAEILSDEQVDGEFLGAAPGGGGEGGRHRQAPTVGSGSSPAALLGAAGQGIFSPVVMHYQRLLRSHTHKAVGDFYLAIFATDFMAFVFLIFGFSFMFSESDQFERVTTWWTTNFVETRQLVVVIVAFFTLVLDRVIYLRRSMKAKLAVQYVSVLVYHYFLFLHVEFGQRASLRFFYVLKCIYFFVSGLQIRSGFPLYTTGQWLLRNFSLKGLIGFHIYYNIPFLWLTRTLLDWAVLPTSLEIFQYFKFIDVYIYLYQNRAINASRGWFKRVLGQKRPIVPRIFQGGGLFLLCALLLFLPFFLFSLANPLFRDRQLIAATYSVDLLLPINNDSIALYSRSATSAKELNGAGIINAGRPYALTIQERSREQVYSVFFSAPSAFQWTPAPPNFDRLNASLFPFVEAPPGSALLDDDNPDRFSTRPTLRLALTGADSEETYSADVKASLTGAQVQALGVAMANLNSTALELPLNIEDDSPNAGTLSRYMTLVAASSRFQPASRRNSGVCLRFHSVLLDVGGVEAPGVVPPAESSVSSVALARRSLWWSVTDCVRGIAGEPDCTCTPPGPDGRIGVTGAAASRGRFDGLTYILQISAVAQIAVGGGTILTLYAVILFSVAQLAKTWFSNKRLIIPVTDMPYTHHLFTLVSDIVYARQDGRLDMEEVLFNGLMDIYRDPHVMVRWTGERHLKPPTVWWEGEGAVDVFPSYRETATEPYPKVKRD
ncbi:hypothetical protein MMPV_001328 [Pyropia vietnamensis]